MNFDLPGEKVNKFNRAVMEEFDSVLSHLESLGHQSQIDALILISKKPGNFIAGADIELIRSSKDEAEALELARSGQILLNRWEDLPFPTVAAIQGAALGGGCELALASSAIVMSDESAARIGLPEVMLGIIPGMGGCVRLPRRVGLASALDMILTGRLLKSEQARKIGLADAVLPSQDFVNSAGKWAAAQQSRLKKKVRIAPAPPLNPWAGPLGKLMESAFPGRSLILSKARQGVISKTRGHYPAPLAAIEVIRKTGGAYGCKLQGKARERALVLEAEQFSKLAVSEISRNLIRIFFLTEAVKKSKGVDSVASSSLAPLHSAAVLGAGVMGGGIAQLLADKKVTARMKDINSAALTLGVQSALKVFKRRLKGKKAARDLQQKLNYISPVLDYSGFESVQAVIEAIVENIEVKKKVFQELESQVSDSCVIASNTSSLSISKMQQALRKPERFVGMHFFNPVHRMPLVEVIRGEKSSDVAVAQIFQFAKQLGKTPVIVKDSPGFLVNRLLMPYLNESIYLLADGAPIEEIDRNLLDFGMPMGPMELIDEVGVDVGDKVSHILYDAFGARMMPAPIQAKVVAAGRLGKKSGKGLYSYTDPKNKRVDSEIYPILGVTPSRGVLSAQEMIDRAVLPMINEASRCLEEGVVASASEVDVAMIMGTGFPPFRGGLLAYADSLGIEEVVKRLSVYHARFGARYEPAPALLARAEHRQRFYGSAVPQQ